MNHVSAKRSRQRLVFAIFLSVWVLRLILGVIDVTGRHVPGYPDAVRGSPSIGQMGFFVVIPAGFVAINVLMFVFASKFPKWLTLVAALLQIFSLLALLFLNGGGV